MKKSLKRALLAGAMIAGPALINNAIFSRAKALGNPLGGEGRFWPWREGDIFYTYQGEGEPILLLHGLYAGASLFEWRKNFAALSKEHEVTAIDWLGFGLSDKPHIRYTDTLFIELLRDFIREVICRPVTIVASSLAAAYAVEAAAALPELVAGLVLICPAGLRELSAEDDGPLQDAKYHVLGAPLLGTSLYNAIVSVPALRSYLEKKVYFDPSFVTDEVVDHYSTAAHQYGAQYAPLGFIAGDFNHNIAESFPNLTQKTIRIVWGREAQQSPLADSEAYLAANAHAELTVFDKAGLLPQDEQAAAFNRLLSEILGAGSELEAEEKPKRGPRKKADEAAA